MTTRTFLAIELDDATRAFIAAQAEPLRAALPGVRFVGSETWHITLAFLGARAAGRSRAARRPKQPGTGAGSARDGDQRDAQRPRAHGGALYVPGPRGVDALNDRRL